MKKFAKKHLAIAVFMMAFGGMTNMAHADRSVIYSQDVSADKEVKQGGAAKIEFAATENEVISGEQAEDANVFVLKVSDSAEHSGWSLIPTGKSVGGHMYNDSDSIPLGSDWSPALSEQGEWFWYYTDATNKEVVSHLHVSKGQVIKPGVYHFTGRVEEYL